MKLGIGILTFSMIFIGVSMVWAADPVDTPMRFTIDAAPWVMTVSAGNMKLTQQDVKPDGNKGYFMLTGENSALVVSFWIEPVKKCSDSKSCRDLIYESNVPLLKEPTNLKKSEIGSTSVFEYHLAASQGVPVKQQNMYAEFVQEGYWVDMHLSKTRYEPKDHVLFEEFIKSVKFEKKQGKEILLTVPEENLLQDAMLVSTEWMKLMDEGKYEECWEKLAKFPKEAMPHEQWITYMQAVRNPLGTVKERIPTKSEMVDALKNLPDQKGAIIQYTSSFENKKSVMETFAVIQEKTGEWKMGFYVTKE